VWPRANVLVVAQVDTTEPATTAHYTSGTPKMCFF
jgi:hypothetical protein